MSEAQSQTAALEFLGAPTTYGTHQVRRIDTHANVVFLAGARALKVKRAVRLPFLDYSSLAKRKAACVSELEANRAFASRSLSPRRADHPRFKWPARARR
jgi:aminoglycoside phosphotransferase family enzyme